jgi:hypothetical protein
MLKAGAIKMCVCSGWPSTVAGPFLLDMGVLGVYMPACAESESVDGDTEG